MASAVLLGELGELCGVLGVPMMRHGRMVAWKETLGQIDFLLVSARHRAMERLQPKLAITVDRSVGFGDTSANWSASCFWVD